jgi:hypothetical protein
MHQIGIVAAVGNELGADGSVWFRDIRIDMTDPSGAHVETKICDLGPHAFWLFMGNSRQGIAHHGLSMETPARAALHLSGTEAEAFLAGGFSLFPLQQGYTYAISGWMKGQNIPKNAVARIVLATLSSDGRALPRGKEFIDAAIGRFASWAESRNVPLYLGEFGVLEWTIIERLGGLQWVSDVLDASLTRGIYYNYHSYHEAGAFGLFGNDAATPVTMESANRRLLNLLVEKQNGSSALFNMQNAGGKHQESMHSEATIQELSVQLKNAEWKIRKGAAIELTGRGSNAEPAIPALIEALRDKEWHVRKPAAEALAAIGPASEAAVPTLIEVLRDEEWQVRRAVAEALTAIGPASEQAVPMLIEALNDEEWQVCRSAAQALSAIGQAARPALPALVDARQHEEWGVRKAALLALLSIAPEATEVLAALQASVDDPEEQVRNVAAGTLKRIEPLDMLRK